MWNEYAREKLLEIDADLDRRHALAMNRDLPARTRPRVLAPLAGVAGRRMRRFGEALESWASPVCAESQSARKRTA